MQNVWFLVTSKVFLTILWFHPLLSLWNISFHLCVHACVYILQSHLGSWWLLVTRQSVLQRRSLWTVQWLGTLYHRFCGQRMAALLHWVNVFGSWTTDPLLYTIFWSVQLVMDSLLMFIPGYRKSSGQGLDNFLVSIATFSWVSFILCCSYYCYMKCLFYGTNLFSFRLKLLT